ncbi:DUF6489 family protein [Sphingobium sp. CR28]|uniref:DUF6489 family protein n=1 Tax=Sphingobium sp. CR28 TaxID=3400272 RepID=UPI003FEE7228
MQFNVKVECTPEEARAFLGLPDLSPIHARYIQAVLDTMDGQASLEQMQKMFSQLSPLGDASLKLFSSMMDMSLGSLSPGSTKKSD